MLASPSWLVRSSKVVRTAFPQFDESRAFDKSDNHAGPVDGTAGLGLDLMLSLVMGAA